MSWRTAKLDELGTVSRGKSRHRPRNDPSLYGGDFPFVQTADISSANYYIEGYSQTYNEKGLSQSKFWKEETLCITIAGENTAKTAVLNFPACFPDSIVGFVPDKEKSNLRFVKHSLDLMKAKFRSVSKGATQDNLSLAKIRSFDIPVPPLPIQTRIASILSAYDDLIENNQRRIGFLEQAARLLYREWFVHFRFPGHETATFVDEMPEGWEQKCFADLCETIGGGTPSTKNPEYWEGGEVTWVTPTDITRNDCLALLDAEKRISNQGLRNSSAKLVPPFTILMTSRASVGFFGMADREVATNQGFINIIPNREILRFYLLFNLLYRVEEIRGHASGSTFPEISKGKFRTLPVIFPSEDVLKRFDLEVRPLLDQVRALKKQIAQLTRARDLLLPRLMDGRIPV